MTPVPANTLKPGQVFQLSNREHDMRLMAMFIDKYWAVPLDGAGAGFPEPLVNWVDDITDTVFLTD